MSDLALLAARPRGFARDVRFGALTGAAQDQSPSATRPAGKALPDPLPDPLADSQPDPLAEAHARGFAQGHAAGRKEAEAEAAERSDQLAALDQAFVLLGEDHAAALRERLRQTLLALCEATILPATLDHELLARRIETAAAMLVRAEDRKLVKLHPDDLALVRPLVPAELKLAADPSLERGALRLDTEDGGVEDGPSQWRTIITEALGEVGASC